MICSALHVLQSAIVPLDVCKVRPGLRWAYGRYLPPPPYGDPPSFSRALAPKVPVAEDNNNGVVVERTGLGACALARPVVR